MGLTVSLCEFARERYHNIAKWRFLWSVLVFAFGSAIVLFLIIAILLFIRASWLPGVISTLGTMSTGVAMTWVMARRREAVTEEEKAWKVVEKHCDPSEAEEAKLLVAKYRLF